MRRVLVVYNPVSGFDLLRPSRAAIQQTLEARDVRVTWVETSPTVQSDLWQAIRTPFERIIVIGGDGTVHEVAELLLAAGQTTPIAILGRGTGNVLASSLGIPLFPLDRAIDFALAGDIDAIDVFRINGHRICLLGAGQGYDALFTHATPRSLKKRIGALAYAWSFIRTFLPYPSQRYSIVVDGVRHQVSAKLVLALNAFGLAGIPIERAVSAHDGLIDVFVLNPRTLWEMILTGLAFIARRPREAIPRLVAFQGTHVSIRQQKGRGIHIDGEVYPDTYLDIEIIPQGLRLVHSRPVDGEAAVAYTARA